MTDEELKNLCELWQKRLRLQDWRIDIRFVDSGELPDLDDAASGGSAQIHVETRTAIVKVLRPDSYNKTADFYKAFPDDFAAERTVIHELLHIPLENLFDDRDEADEFKIRAQEQAIEQITDALYAAYRGE